MGRDDRREKSRTHGPVFYVSGEENASQIASRAARLGIPEPQLLLFCETDADYIAETIASYTDESMTIPVGSNEDEPLVNSLKNPPCLVVIDSIQTMICGAAGSSAAGGVTQVRGFVSLRYVILFSLRQVAQRRTLVV